MPEDFYPFVDSGDAAPDNSHIIPSPDSGDASERPSGAEGTDSPLYATRVAVYDDMLSAPRVIVVEQQDIRTYLESVTNTVYRCMKEQGGHLALQVIREIVENLIHARFVEPIISILDGGNTIRFADQGPGIKDKERAFEFGVTSASREQKRYIRGTGSGFPIVSDYLENAGGAISIEDNIGQGTVVTVSVDPARVEEISRNVSRGAAVRGSRGGAMGTARAMAPGAGAQAAAAGTMPEGQMPAQQPAVTAPVAGAAPGYPGGYPAAYPAMAYPQPYPAATGYQQPVAPGYQQFSHQFSTTQQVPGQQVVPYPVAPMAAPAPVPAATTPHVSERGMLALRFLLENGSGGPTDLADTYGESTPTWSRELATLSTTGLVVKQGQKRILTDMGRAWLEQQLQQQ